jgi:uncharacterized protein (UPF0261 family)
MVNFHAPETVPPEYRRRKFYQHNANVTLMRTTVQESEQIGREIARKVSTARSGTAAILLPRRGVSAIDGEGRPFDDPQAREAMFRMLRSDHGDAQLVELDCHINDPEFAEAAAGKLIELMRNEES